MYIRLKSVDNLLVIAGLASMTTSSIHAKADQECAVDAKPGYHNHHKQPKYTGPYINLNMGVAHLHSKTQANHNPQINDSKATEDYFLSDNNVAGDFRFGWNFAAAPKWIWGIEGSVGLSALKAQDSYTLQLIQPPVKAKTTLKERYNLGLAGKLGYQINSTVISYVKLGAKFSRFRFTYQDIINGVGQSIQTRNSTKPGLEAGLGFNMRLNETWSINSDYSYTFYNTLKLNNADNLNNGLVYKTKPRVGRFMLGFTYHIDYK